MKRSRTYKKPSVLKIIIKTLLTLLIVWFVIGTTRMMIDNYLSFDEWKNNLARQRNLCEYYYTEGKIGELKENLRWNDLKEKDGFDVYVEITDGYEEYQLCRTYQKAAAAGVKEAESQAERYQQKVLENAKNCRNERNKRYLDAYADDV